MKTSLTIRNYQATDYEEVSHLYKQSGVFDEETDSEIRLIEKISRDPESILIVTDGQKVRGSISLIEDGRIAILFRLVVDSSSDRRFIRSQLIRTAEKIVKDKGYNEVHIMSLEEDTDIQDIYVREGFTKGNTYRWFWKKLG